jgi:hypothetical protein
MLQPFQDLLGAGGVLTDSAAVSRYVADYRQFLLGEAQTMSRSRFVAEVRSIVRLARLLDFDLVP